MIFSSGCFTLALYYAISQVIRYIQNNDVSIITHKTFNDASSSNYPSFSICLKGKDIFWSRRQTLLEKTGMTSLQYVDLLEGRKGLKTRYDEKTLLYKKEPVNESKVLQMEPSDFYLRHSDIIVGTHFFSKDDFNNTHYGYGKEAVNLKNIPFHIGHRTPYEICLTRDSEDKVGLTRLHDEIFLNRSLFDPGRNFNLELKIIFHFPGQLVERIQKPTSRFTLKQMSVSIWTKKFLKFPC